MTISLRRHKRKRAMTGKYLWPRGIRGIHSRLRFYCWTHPRQRLAARWNAALAETMADAIYGWLWP